MRYPDEIIQEVIARNDIVTVVSSYVALTPKSNNHFGLCPFHNEKSPSFSVNQEKQIFYCFGCSAGGNALTFVMKMENLDFVAALKLLADRVHFRLPEKEETEIQKQNRAAKATYANINKEAAIFYHNYLNSPQGSHAMAYLQARGVSPNLIKRFGLGLSPDGWDNLLKSMPDTPPTDIVGAGLATQSKKDPSKFYDRFRGRLMFPIIDPRGRVVGFGGRIMTDAKDEAKYLNTPETQLFHKSDNLYGLNLARKARTTELIIVEGYMDVLAMHQFGFTNTVAVLGTALNDSHTRLLKNAGCNTVILMLDGDAAGTRATLRAIPPLEKAGIRIKVLNIADHSDKAKDPDDFLKTHGKIAMAEKLQIAQSHITFQVSIYQKNHDLTQTTGRIAFTAEAAKLLATLPSAIEIEAYSAEIAKTSGISTGAILTEVNRQKGTLGQDKKQNAPIIVPQRIRAKPSKTNPGSPRSSKALDTLLQIIFRHPDAAAALHNSQYIPLADIPQGLYQAMYMDLLALAYQNVTYRKELSPAEVIAAFSTESETASNLHSKITQIFVDSHSQYDSKEALTKALNETAFIVKRDIILAQMKTTQDQNLLHHLGIQLRQQPNIKI